MINDNIKLIISACLLFPIRLNVSIDDDNRLSYMDFLSVFDHKAEKTCQPSPDAVRQIQSLDSLSPDLALAKMQELVSSSASNLYKVTNIHLNLHLSFPSVSLLADHIFVSASDPGFLSL